MSDEPRTCCEACEKWTRVRFGCDSCAAMIGECCWGDICAKCGNATEPE